MLFPVKIPYTISADITKYSGPAFEINPIETYIAEKKQELKMYRRDVYAVTEDATPFIKQAAEFIGASSIDDLEDLALTLEEDIAILKDGIVKGICFCFPSGFIPARTIGLDFFHVHEPVADGDKLRASGPKVSSLISKEGAMFRRYVWGISSLGSLSQHPGYERPVATTIDDLYFRTETQTTVGLANNVALFFVKVEMHPLRLVWDDLEKRKQLVESVCSMSDAVLEYKNLRKIKSIIIDNQ